MVHFARVKITFAHHFPYMIRVLHELRHPLGRLVVLQGRALAELTDHLGKLASRGDAAGRRARGAQAHLGIFFL